VPHLLEPLKKWPQQGLTSQYRWCFESVNIVLAAAFLDPLEEDPVDHVRVHLLA
jgi:hypothetical protein